MLSRRRLMQLTAVGSATLAGCTSGSTGGGTVEETSEVAMVDQQFQPRNVHVDAGTTVTWSNEDDTTHTVTSASDNWEFDERVPGGGSVERAFEESGVYDVYCTLHGTPDLSGMSMKVGVGDASIEEPLASGDGGGGGAYG